MDIQIFPAAGRGRTRLDWLDSRHSFSFGHFYDPRRMGFGPLRVINDDRVAPDGGFATHPHANMEIISIVLSGALAHRDSLGNVETIQAGEVQRMSAGTGIEHSEYNPSATEPVHFLQVWLRPTHPGRQPSYEQRSFADADRLGRWQCIVSPGGAQGSLDIDQDARLYLGRLPAASALGWPMDGQRQAYLHLISGRASLAGRDLVEGDGVGIASASPFSLQAQEETFALLFDLPLQPA